MPSITFDQFEVGLDLRKGMSTSEPSRLRVLDNAYVTTGRVLRKRPGFTKVATLEAGTIGLVSGGGKLNTFQQYGGGVVHASTDFVCKTLTYAFNAAYGQPLTKIHSATPFNGFLYLAAQFQDQTIAHYYVKTGDNPNRVTDVNCPNNKIILKSASRILSPTALGTVKYSALEAPKDWTTISTAGIGAGYLPTGTHAVGDDVTTALGAYDGKLCAFFHDALQQWALDADDRNNAYVKTIEGLGTSFDRSPVNFSGDLLFLADSGFRSISSQNQAQNLVDIDIGSPIDTLVQNEVLSTSAVIAVYYPGQNQYWCFYPLAGTGTTRAWVLSFSKSAKVSAWSRYTLPFVVSDACSHLGGLYARSGNDVYLVEVPNVNYVDHVTNFETRIEFPFLDFKAPGVDKYISAMDLVVEGEVDVQFRFDPNDPTKITDPVRVSGNTRAGSMIPVEITSPAIAPVFTDVSGNAMQLDAMTFHYELLAAQ